MDIYRKKLIYWFLAWFLGWGGFLWLYHAERFTYIGSPIIIGGYFFVVAVLLYTLFRRDIQQIVSAPTSRIAALCMSVLVVLFGAYTLPEHVQSILLWTETDIRFYVSKPFEIVFQQVLIVTLAAILYQECKNRKQSIFYFAGLFFAAHIPMILFFSWQESLFFTAFSLLGGALFSALILWRKDGYVYSFIVHLLFYALIGTMFAQLGIVRLG